MDQKNMLVGKCNANCLILLPSNTPFITDKLPLIHQVPVYLTANIYWNHESSTFVMQATFKGMLLSDPS